MLTLKSGRGTRSGCGIGESRCFTVSRVALVSFSASTKISDFELRHPTLSPRRFGFSRREPVAARTISPVFEFTNGCSLELGGALRAALDGPPVVAAAQIRDRRLDGKSILPVGPLHSLGREGLAGPRIDEAGGHRTGALLASRPDAQEQLAWVCTGCGRITPELLTEEPGTRQPARVRGERRRGGRRGRRWRPNNRWRDSRSGRRRRERGPRNFAGG